LEVGIVQKRQPRGLLELLSPWLPEGYVQNFREAA